MRIAAHSSAVVQVYSSSDLSQGTFRRAEAFRVWKSASSVSLWAIFRVALVSSFRFLHLVVHSLSRSGDCVHVVSNLGTLRSIRVQLIRVERMELAIN